MFTALIVLGAFAYLQAGYQIGKKSQRVWKKQERNVASWLLFPVSSVEDKIGHGGNTLFCGEVNEEVYCVGMAFSWAFKLVFNAGSLTVYGLYRVLKPTVFKPFVYLMESPDRLIQKAQRRLESTRERRQLKAAEVASEAEYPEKREPRRLFSSSLPNESRYAKLDREEKVLLAKLESVQTEKSSLEAEMGDNAEKAAAIAAERL